MESLGAGETPPDLVELLLDFLLAYRNVGLCYGVFQQSALYKVGEDLPTGNLLEPIDKFLARDLVSVDYGDGLLAATAQHRSSQ